MARIRNIKPEFFTSESVSELPLRARLTWIGLWTHCDNHGRTRDNLRLIKAAVWPLDNVSLREIEDDLTTLAEHERIVRYEVAGKRYLMITNWGEHQYGAFKGAPKYPPPVHNPTNGSPNGGSPAETDKSGLGLNESRHDQEKFAGIQGSGVRGQGEGTHARASPPPSRCPEHLDEPAAGPCGPCGDARRAAGAWAADQTRIQAEQRSADAHAAAETRALAIANCQLCDPDGYRNGAVCDHDPDHLNRSARGRAAVQAALKRTEETA